MALAARAIRACYYYHAVWAKLTKQLATRGYCAQLILEGQSLVESISVGQQMAAETGRTFVHPYDDEEVITGQGTIGLEIMEDLPDADYILVPVGAAACVSVRSD